MFATLLQANNDATFVWFPPAGCENVVVPVCVKHYININIHLFLGQVDFFNENKTKTCFENIDNGCL